MHNQHKLEEVHRRADAQQADWPTMLVTVHHDAQNAWAEAKPRAQHEHGQEPAPGAAAAAACIPSVAAHLSCRRSRRPSRVAQESRMDL